MNIDKILSTLSDWQVDYILIGGVNFLLRHEPKLTFDVDIWVAGNDDNLRKLNQALQAMGSEWGPTEKEWAPVSANHEWLKRQSIALDVFLDVTGLEGMYKQCKAAALRSETAFGTPYFGLSDQHMLACQEALPAGETTNFNQRLRWLNPPCDLNIDIKKREEAKRNSVHDPVARWAQIQDMIAWVEANLPQEKRRNRPRVAKLNR